MGCGSDSTSLSGSASFALSFPARSSSRKCRTSEEREEDGRTTISGGGGGGQQRKEKEKEEEEEEEDERETSGTFSSILGKWQQQLVPSSSPKRAKLRLLPTRAGGEDQAAPLGVGNFALIPDGVVVAAADPLAFSPALSGSLLFSQTSSMSPKAPKWVRRMSSVVGLGPGLPPPPPPGAVDAFVAFVEADSFPEAREHFSKLLAILELEPGRHPDFYPKLKLIKEHLPFRYREIFKFLTEKRKAKPYSGYPCEKQKVLVVGSGPCGLRTAIEAQLLGSEVVVVERRDDFTRHNILKLWKFLVHDFKQLGVKKFIGNFCSGQINHVGIRTLQLFLAKVALILGVRIVCPARMVELVEPEAGGQGWKARFDPPGSWADNYYFNVLVAASGKNVCVDGFNRRSLDAKLSIAVTANFVNGGTREEAQV